MVGRLVVQALAKIDGEITRKALMDTIMKIGTFDLGGVTLTYGPGDNQGMDRVYITEIQADGSFKPLVESSS